MPLPASFFNTVRSSLFKGELKQGQVNSLNAIYDECVRRNLFTPQIAYIMATPYHEVGPELNPATIEYGWQNNSRYNKTGISSDGTRATNQPYASLYYYGRGFAQLTFLDNYVKMGSRRGKDYAGQPELLLTMTESVWCLVEGMQYGLFTGKRLSDYITPGKVDYVSARRIVNGTDKDDLIAEYAKKFFMGLPIDIAKAPPLPQVNPAVQAKAEPRGLWADLKKWWKG